MRIVCVICTDQITEDLVATPFSKGGHTFHETCLMQWLGHNKTCPQCREKCMRKNVIRLFVDSSDSLSQANVELDPEEMKDKLALQERQMKLKEKALSEAQKSLDEIRSEVLAWQAQYSDVRKELKEVKGTSDTLRKELKQKQVECDHARAVEKEAEKLRRRMSTMEGVQKMLSHSKEEVEALIKTYSSPAQLATFVVAMKRDYEALKEKKVALQREKDKLCQECSQMRRECRLKDSELRVCRERLSEVERDLQVAEQEKDNMHKKVELLEKALESPGSKLQLRRILESPMPDNIKNLRAYPSDLGASPLLASTNAKSKTGCEERQFSDSDDAENQEPQDRKKFTKEPSQLAGVKRARSGLDLEVLMPVNKISKPGQSSRTFASGYNGMGGQSHFAIPSSKFVKPPSAAGGKKPVKFAPRFSSKPNKPKPKLFQPTLRL